MKIRLHTFCAVLICALGFISSAPQSFAQMRLIPKIPRVGTQRPFIRRPPLPRINLEEHLDLFIKQQGRFPSPYAQDPLERFLRQEINRALIQAKISQNPNLTRLEALKKQLASTPRAPQQILEEMKLFIEDNERWPSSSSEILSERALREDFDNAIRHAENPRDPTIARLIALHRYWVRERKQNVSTGQQREVFEEFDVTTPQKVEEIIEAVSLPHTTPNTIVEKTKSIQLFSQEQAATERQQFGPWLKFMQEKANFPMLVNKKTVNALSALNRAIKFDKDNHQFRPHVTYLLRTINKYVGMLGVQEDKNTNVKKKKIIYYKLIYTGSEDPDMLPQADKFHIVAEEKGISKNGELASQVEIVKHLYNRRKKEGSPSSVYLFGEDDYITALGIETEVDIQTIKADLETIIENLLPRNYTVRMGMHEIGLSRNDLKKFQQGKVHLHLENTFPTQDKNHLPTHHSISLDVEMFRFIGTYNNETNEFRPFSNHIIAQNYLTLFDKFLSDDARTALQKIASEPN